MKLGATVYIHHAVEGGKILFPLGPLPWRSRCKDVVDKYGVHWYISV